MFSFSDIWLFYEDVPFFCHSYKRCPHISGAFLLTFSAEERSVRVYRNVHFDDIPCLLCLCINCIKIYSFHAYIFKYLICNPVMPFDAQNTMDMEDLHAMLHVVMTMGPVSLSLCEKKSFEILVFPFWRHVFSFWWHVLCSSDESQPMQFFPLHVWTLKFFSLLITLS